mmetsp:Transcript_105937/g.199498  ORF Transcript_105937/g.199498 Transcript_105937/m.199498 type:complete len:230 (-) Transcript_105937:27-716(-)
MHTPIGLYRSHRAHLNPTKPAAGCSSKRLHRHDVLEQKQKEPNPHMLQSTEYFIWCMHKHKDPALMKGGKKALARLISENCGYVAGDDHVDISSAFNFEETPKVESSRDFRDGQQLGYAGSQRGSSAQGSRRQSRAASQSSYPYPAAADNWAPQRRQSAGSAASVSSVSTATRERRAQSARRERGSRELESRERGSRGGGYGARRGSSLRPASARVDRHCQTSFSERSC